MLGDRDASRAALERVYDEKAVLARMPMRSIVPDVCIVAGDVARAAHLYEITLPLSGRVSNWVPFSICEGSFDRIIGRLAAMIGRMDEAEHHFEKALAMDAGLRAEGWLARTRRYFADMLRTRGRPADLRRAAELEAQARATFEAFGMDLFLEEAPASKRPAPVSARAPRPVFREEGELMAIDWSGETHRFKRADGLRYLATLVSRPNEEVHVLDLAGGARDTGDAGEMLDAKAKAAYRRRLGDLRDAAEEARGFGDATRAERAEAEIEAIEAEIARAVGLGGRDRKAAAAAERARVNVTMRIRKAIARVEEISPALGHHLKTCVKTGIFCGYAPSPDGE
jgi:hypothetical protein